MATATSIQFWNVTPKSVKRSASQVPKSAAYRLDTGVDLDAPPRHLAIAAVGGVHAGITPGCIRSIVAYAAFVIVGSNLQTGDGEGTRSPLSRFGDRPG
jgi:hypothetical protein